MSALISNGLGIRIALPVFVWARATSFAPIASDTIADLIFTQNTGIQAIATAGHFSGMGGAYTVTGPAGVTIDSATGVVSISTTALISAEAVTVTKANDAGSDQITFYVTVEGAVAALAIAGTPDTTVNVGEPYIFTPSITGAVEPFVVTLDSGALPAGLSIDSTTGEITGTPTTAEVQSNIGLLVTVDDETTARLAAFSITVSGDTTAPTLSNITWDDTSHEAGFIADEAGTLNVATFDVADGEPAPDGLGGWTDPFIETDSVSVAGAEPTDYTVAFTSASQGANRVAYYLRDDEGNDSLLQTEVFEPNVAPANLSEITSLDMVTSTTVVHLFTATEAGTYKLSFDVSNATAVRRFRYQILDGPSGTFSSDFITSDGSFEFTAELALDQRLRFAEGFTSMSEAGTVFITNILLEKL